MTDDIAQDFKQIRVSRLTLGLIMTVASVSAVVVWNAAAVANRIDGMESSVSRLQAEMEEYGEPDAQVLTRLTSIERLVEEFDVKTIEGRLTTIETWAYVELTERLEELEEFWDELERDGEQLRYELDDLHHHKDAFRDILSQDPRDFAVEIMNQRFSW